MRFYLYFRAQVRLTAHDQSYCFYLLARGSWVPARFLEAEEKVKD